jgi:hypothetical protein
MVEEGVHIATLARVIPKVTIVPQNRNKRGNSCVI